jgi:hypothetical protein
MNLFQYLALAGLGAMVLAELVRLRRGSIAVANWTLRVGVWLAAMLAVAQPMLLQRLADFLGIGRGTDVLLYLLVFAFFGTSFFLYARMVRLQRQFTHLVRMQAIQTARKGNG